MASKIVLGMYKACPDASISFMLVSDDCFAMFSKSPAQECMNLCRLLVHMNTRALVYKLACSYNLACAARRAGGFTLWPVAV